MIKCILSNDPDKEVHYCEEGWDTCACGKYTYEELTTGDK